MLYLLVKAAVSGVLIAVISEVARKNPGWGGLLASLPLVSLIAILWLWRDTHDPQRVAEQAMSTFWFVLPSLPMFLLIPLLLRQGAPFWAALLAGCVLTVALYLGMVQIGPKFGLKL